jgi:alkylation response protein AidB-like acyl-CoA dehydrogenase
MDFSLTQEQDMLLDSARRYVAEQHSFEARRAILASAAGRSKAVWAGLADLGLLALNVPEQHGGMGAGAVETMLAAIALGEGLVVEPFLSSAVIATRLLAAAASPAQQAKWLPGLASGELVAVLVHDVDSQDAEPAVRAARTADGWRLTGSVPVVYHAPLADLLLVVAQDEGGAHSLFAVAAGTAGVALDAFRTVDDQVAADVGLDGVVVADSARVGTDIRGALAAALDYGLAALLADTIGALDRALAATIEYTKTRVQFGGPIARFQALQHRMADMTARIEPARSMMQLAVSACVDSDAAVRAAALSAAKVTIGDAARYVGQQSVQLHGGMGVSDDVAISHYFRRLVAAEIRFGSTEAHLSRYARQMGPG